MLNQDGRSLQPAQGGGLVTAGPMLVVTASLSALHVVWVLLCPVAAYTALFSLLFPSALSILLA